MSKNKYQEALDNSLVQIEKAEKAFKKLDLALSNLKANHPEITSQDSYNDTVKEILQGIKDQMTVK